MSAEVTVPLWTIIALVFFGSIALAAWVLNVILDRLVQPDSDPRQPDETN